MGHFARVDEDGSVLEIHVISNDDLAGMEFPESELLGQKFQEDRGIPGAWLQCSYSGSFRGAYPGIGWIYDAGLDQFIAPPMSEPSEETP